MTADRVTNAAAGTTGRQKAIAIILVLVVIFIIWQMRGLFTSKTPAPIKPAEKPTVSAVKPAGGATGMAVSGDAAIPPSMTPQATNLPVQSQGMTPNEIELMKMQQETQAKYLAALNELQVLKVQRDIAEANQAIMTAKLATVASEKKIVDMLTPPTPPSTPQAYAANLANQAPINPEPKPVPVEKPSTPAMPALPDVNYTVISVSQLQYNWSAVVGAQGSLYNVHVGDMMPPDRSKVIRIDKSGIVLEKDGVKRKVSLVPII